MRRLLTLGLGAMILLFGVTGTTSAHDSRPLYVEITELQASGYRLKWQAPPSVPAFNAPNVTLPESCVVIQTTQTADQPKRLSGTALYRCNGSLSGKIIAIKYPIFNPSVSTLIKLHLGSGEHRTVLLAPDETGWVVPHAEAFTRVARDYAALGVRHIWAGLDHLLFLICLVWISGTLYRTLIAVTGFTMAHSLTLTLSALDIVNLPVPPVEATIALSVMFLAREIAIGQRQTLTWRYPLVVSSAFGLLHGLGFAAVLREIGLPQTEFLTGLLFFNVGVEIGQVVFLAAILFLFKIMRQLSARSPVAPHADVHLRLASSGVAGTLASYWLIDRCTAFIT